MAVRGRAVQKNHNPTLFSYKVISINHYFFHNGCLSRPYLGKYIGIEMKLGL